MHPRALVAALPRMRSISALTATTAVTSTLLATIVMIATMAMTAENAHAESSADAIREAALAYDRLPFDEAEISWARGECISIEPGSPNEYRCRQALGRRGRVSDRPDFLALTGFAPGVFGFNSKQREALPSGAMNQIAGRTYESPRELFAAAVVSAALDLDFACERPALFHFLKHEPGVADLIGNAQGCSPNNSAKRHDDSDTSRGGSANEAGLVGVIDPARVYRIDLGIASAGEELLERWGHVMFRVVVCAPYRKEPGAECLKDTAHHIVYSFNGDGRDDTGLLEGLTGKIPARLFKIPLKDALQYYLKRGRKVEAYPLRLSPLEQDRLLALLAEMHSYYDGRWNDLTNNCVTHSLMALVGSLKLGRVPLERPPQTPEALAKFLLDEGITGAHEPMTYLWH